MCKHHHGLTGQWPSLLVGVQDLHEFFHSFTGPFLYVLEMTDATGMHRFGVDKIDGAIGFGILNQSRSGINIKRRSDDDKDVGFTSVFGCDRNHGHTLAKENDEWAQERPIISLSPRFYGTILLGQFADVGLIVRITTGTYLGQFAM